MSTATPPLSDEELRATLRTSFQNLGLRPLDCLVTDMTKRPPLMRRGVVLPPIDAVELLALTRDSTGVLRWEPGAAAFGVGLAPRRASRAALPAGRVVQQFAYQQIAPNQIVSTLETLDRWMTPQRGLRQWNPASGQLEPFPDGSKAAGKNVLLFVHGTFSNCDNTIAGIRATPHQRGDQFLAAAAKKYDLVLTFDHPTVGVSPVMNAFDLAAALRPLPKALHIVGHSRGGLVTRWFLEGFATHELRQAARAVLVGSTIGGTSLAAPARLKSAMDYLANLGEMLGSAAKLGAAHPFLAAGGVLMQIFTSVVNAAAKTPMFDAAIALVPGLHGQSLIGNNPEILRLRANTGAYYANSGIRYYAVLADFQPKDPGWNFLQYFSKPMQRIANWGADLIFPDKNDLVADCSSMIDLADQVPITDVLDFGTTDSVHHTNYFSQERTIKFIAQSLEI